MTEHTARPRPLDRVAEGTREIEWRRQVAEALRDLLAAVNSGLGVDDIFARVVDQTHRLLGSDASAIYVPAGQDLLGVRASSGLESSFLERRIRVGAPVTGLTFSTRRTTLVFDVRAALAAPDEPDQDVRVEDRGGYLEVRHVPARGLDPAEHGPLVDASEAGYRALMAVPLAVKDQASGVLTLCYRAPRRFTEAEVSLANSLADHAALAMQLRRLQIEATERLRDLEALYGADEMLHRSLRLEEVLQALVDMANSVLQADMASVLVWDAEHAHLVPGATRGFRPETVAQMTHAPGEGVTTIVALTGQAVIVEDARHDPRVAHRITDPEGIRSLMHVPVTVGDEIFGVFGVNYRQPHAFAAAEQRLLHALARRAGVAIQNARVYGESEARRRELEALYQADNELHGSLRLDEVLRVLIDLPVAIGQAEMVSLLLWDEQQQRFVVGGVRGLSGAILQETFTLDDVRMPRSSGSGIVEVHDAASDERVSQRMRTTITREGVWAWISSPIRIGGRLFGSFSFGYGHRHVFTDRERRLLVALAQRAALAIHNARLYEQAQQAAALEERQRLARELHDAVTQTLFSASLIAEVAPRLWERDQEEGRRRLEELRTLTRGALAEMRALLLELRPDALVEAPLEQLVRQLAEAVRSRAGLVVEVAASAVGRLPPDVQVGFYRIAQEALNNVLKHAQAHRVWVSLGAEAGQIGLTVRDDGRGFDAAQVEAGHLGLAIMRERAAAIGAILEVASHAGGGAQVTLRWTGTTARQRARPTSGETAG